MKKLLSVALVLALMLSLGVSAFAQIWVKDKDNNVITESPVNGDAKMIVVNGETLEVTGNVSTDEAPFNAIDAQDATIIIGGSVTESGIAHAISANNSNVTIAGDLTESGAGNAINAENGATVIVVGDVSQSGDGDAINVSGGATVLVGGDVNGEIINCADSGTVVVVEGTVSGMILASDENNKLVYVGAGESYSGVRYLIGFAEGEDFAKYNTDFTKIEGNHFSSDLITGASGKEYLSTLSANPRNLGLAWITFGAKDSSKELSVEGELPAGVTAEVLENGQVKLTLDSSFKGGLQNLKFILSGGSDPTPVIYVVPVSTVKTVEFQAPEGFEEGLIKALDSADHAGLTVDGSLLAEGGEHSVKVTLDGKELPADAYRFCINADGSLSLTLSNTYMFSLGDGSYDLVATIDGLEIPFTVAVAK